MAQIPNDSSWHIVSSRMQSLFSLDWTGSSVKIAPISKRLVIGG